MTNKNDTPLAYGPNVWLIDEMYRQYKEDHRSVSERWQDFFDDYTPSNLLATEPDAAPEPEKDEKVEIPEDAQPLKGVAELIVENMEQSLGVPTATSTRTLPVKILEENRRLINLHLAATSGGKVSFTHIIGWAILRAIDVMPAMKTSYLQADGKHYKVIPPHVNFGIAVDVERSDGTRTLLVPNIKKADTLTFKEFFVAYNDIIRKVRQKKIVPDDFAGTTLSLTNPGTIGTNYSVPRLMKGQSAIFGTGAIAYPAEWESADPAVIARLGVSKVITVTSTYDHRVIQGAESGMFLAAMYDFLMGRNGFYEGIYESMGMPFSPVHLSQDVNPEYDTNPNALIEKQANVLSLLNMYRVRGHLQAYTNPLISGPRTHDELNPAAFGLTVWDYDREFVTLGMAGKDRAPLRDILDIMRDAYSRTIGIEYMHIQDREQKRWFRTAVEGVPRSEWLDKNDKSRILEMLVEAEAFEKFLHTKYIGHKRFSLEGSETLIPVIDRLFSQVAPTRIEEVVMGMAHRGRLNVLANILGKEYRQIFKEFQGNIDPDTIQGSGDVKYHLGASGSYTGRDGNTITIHLASNPSHLEAVDPVVEGMVRGLQDRRLDRRHETVLPVLIHGDAAFAGQGVVAETLNLSKLPGYRTGGTIHIIVNNFIGFTTSPEDARSSVYATDVAKMVQAPIFHVNGEDPEAAAHVIDLALAFRQEFKKDVVVDIMCYRKLGHNEADDPSYTQPKMYSQIKEKRSIRKLYTEALVNRGDITVEEAGEYLDRFHKLLEEAFEATKSDTDGTNIDYSKNVIFEVPEENVGEVFDTSISRESIDEIADAINRFPNGFTVHPKLVDQFKARQEQVKDGRIDWALAEQLSIGSLLLDGVYVRMSGQDSRRGTFSQRHAVAVDYNTEKIYVPLNNVRADQAKFRIFDSLLSEYAALGFEYGWSVVWQEALAIWEAQFGDFVNGAQIIIDQFITAAEDKWGQRSGLTLLLPHGFEGQGPEHSSARLERFLVLCAENNIRVAYPSNAAQYFHLLRRQGLAKDRKPLIVLTPKSLLRADVAKSSIEEFESGRFQFIMHDPAPPERATRLLLCAGKVYYDLEAYRREHGVSDTAIIRIEQFYPFPFADFQTVLDRYPDAKDVRWVQEEPRNMGAWFFMYSRLRDLLQQDRTLQYIGRLVSGSPATGNSAVHRVEQEHLVEEAFS